MTITLIAECPLCHVRIWDHHLPACSLTGVWYGTRDQTVLDWIAEHHVGYYRTGDAVGRPLPPTPFASAVVDGYRVYFDTYRTRAENLADLLNTCMETQPMNNLLTSPDVDLPI